MWYMKPISVSVEVSAPLEEVFDFLDVMANHVQFTDHMLHDWELSGPPRGVGSRATVRTKAAGVTDTIEMEVVSANRPTTIVERNVGAKGRRVATGTYTLAGLQSGGTSISFEYAWQQAPPLERLAEPFVRAYLRRNNQRALQRLAEQLESQLGSQETGSAASAPAA
jgi:carbon monoxide dehydrogenase subunit G